jgi:uncharacterized glyoxalase superfamily protein PhnB
MQYKKLTPNLVVADVSASSRFYQEVLGFRQELQVPEQPPLVFASVVGDGVEIFLNLREATNDFKALSTTQLSSTFSLYIEVEGFNEVLERVRKHGAKIVSGPQEMFYGMREFTFLDHDGYIVIIAERMK